MPEETEEQFLQAVRGYAHALGWKTWHHRRSKGTTPGWPDVQFVRVPEFFVAEFKRQKGKTSAAQDETLDQLQQCGVEVHVWRPSDWPEIEKRLKR